MACRSKPVDPVPPAQQRHPFVPRIYDFPSVPVFWGNPLIDLGEGGQEVPGVTRDILELVAVGVASGWHRL